MRNLPYPCLFSVSCPALQIELEGDLYPALFEALYRREMYKDLVDMYCNLKDRADLTSPKCVSPVLLAMGQVSPPLPILPLSNPPVPSKMGTTSVIVSYQPDAKACSCGPSRGE